MKRAGVIGYPIAHSKSPIIHGYWLETLGIEGRYDRYAIEPDQLADGVAALVRDGVCGFNVTIPHKLAIMDLCSDISETAQKIGAVNTVTVLEDGRLSGDNTDAFGFRANLESSVDTAVLSMARTALVLGAGGAARAIVYALSSMEISKIVVVNRTFDRAAELASSLGALAAPWEMRTSIVRDADLIVNTTSLGMAGQPALDLDLSSAKAGTIVADIVYTPLETPLLRAARDKGLVAVEGAGMLLHQARPGFERWFGVRPDVDGELERRLLAASSS